MILGPSTLLCPGLFRYGSRALSGAQVVEEDTGLRAIRPGAPSNESKASGL